MKMTELLRWGVPPELIVLWQQRESAVLLPLQEQTIKRHGLFSEENLLIQAPTSSGKTFIGEMAAVHTALRRKKVVYLVPLKALAEEKFRDFREKYQDYGIRVIISTRDRREYDRDLETGRFELAVVVYEKLAQLLVRRPERMEEIDLVIADELELLSDPERGGGVELLLTRILQSGTRMLGLSAVIGEAERLARWLRARLVYYERRPVELRYGVLHEGVFRFRTHNDQLEDQEALVDACSDSPWELLSQNACALAERGESCLVFVKAKHESRRGAALLAGRVALPAAHHTVEALRGLEPTRSRAALLDTLNHGVAFHNADLSPDERHCVEEGFRAGEVRLLVSTSTLAVGLNLPAQNVFITPDKWRYDARLGMPWKTPISRNEYENMGGRAGRYGAGQAYGRSVLIATTPYDQETLWRRYVEGEREGVHPRLAREALESHVLQLVASRACATHEALAAFFEQTLSGQWVWGETLTQEEVAFRVRSAANRGADAGLLATAADGRLEATPLGAAVASKGIGIDTARELEHWLQVCETRPWPEADLLFAAAASPDGRQVQLGLTTKEYEEAGYMAQLKAQLREVPLEADTPLNRLRNCNLQPFFDDVRAVKATLILAGWIAHEPVQELEERYDTMGGQILAAAEQVSWLVDATAALATALGAPDALVQRLGRLALRVQHGLHEEALGLRAALPAVARPTLLNLYAHGWYTPEAIGAAAPEQWQRWLRPADVRALKAWAASAARDAPASAAPAAAPPQRTAPVLIIDDAQPGRIVLDGERIELQDKQYRLIRTLAKAPGTCVSYDVIYRAVWGETIVENNQMHFQKRRLLAAVAARCPHRAQLVTTRAKRGFVLELDRDAVELRAGAVSSAA